MVRSSLQLGGSHVCSDDFFKAEAVRCRDDRIKELEDEKKKQQQQTATEVKALAILDAKASCFEENDYKGVSVPELTALLAWYNILKEKMKKSEMVAKWKEMRLNHVPPPTFQKWGDSDEEELIRLKTTEVDITETALGCYAALMKRQVFASVLDFTDEEWTNLKKLRDASTAMVATTAEATMDAIKEPGELERDNTMIGAENGEGMV